MTLAVYVVHPDGSREVRRPRAAIVPVSDGAWELHLGSWYPECACPRHRAEAGPAVGGK